MPSLRLRSILCAGPLLLLGQLHAAHAEGRDPVAAEALFAQGRAAMKRGEYAAACAKFDESEALDPSAVGTLLNLAECEEHIGHTASAWQHLRHALDVLPPSDDRVTYVMARVVAIEPRVPKVLIRLAPTAPASTRVKRGSIELGPASLGEAQPIDPGSYTVEASAEGFPSRRFTVEIHEGESKTLEVNVGERWTAAPATRKPSRSHTRDIAGFAVGGTGVVAIGLGAVTGLLAIDRNGVMNQQCNPGRTSCSQEGLDAGAQGKTFAAVSTVGFAAGLALLAAGGYLLLTNHPAGNP